MASQFKECSNILSHNFVVDSRSRNLKEKENDYLVDLPSGIRNVKSIELKGSVLPRTEYNVNSSNKFLDFSVGTWISKVTYIGIIGTDGESLPAGSGSIVIPISNFHFSTHNGDATTPAPTDSPYTQTFAGDPGRAASITVNHSGGQITSIVITEGGCGFSNSTLPNINHIAIDTQLTKFKIEVGMLCTAELREGEYNIGGNPLFTRINATSTTFPVSDLHSNPQGWVPTELLKEIENSMSYSVLTHPQVTKSTLDISADAVPPTGSDTFIHYTNYRRPWDQIPWDPLFAAPEQNSGCFDYPLLFTARIVSQYPEISAHQDPPLDFDLFKNIHFQTNSCEFNRIQLTQCLIIRATLSGGTKTWKDPEDWGSGSSVDHMFFDKNGYGYHVIAYRVINSQDHVYFCKLVTPTAPADLGNAIVSGGLGYIGTTWANHPWQGLPSNTAMFSRVPDFTATATSLPASTVLATAGTHVSALGSPVTSKLTLENYELLFASGPNNTSSCHRLLGFDKIDYGTKWNNKDKYPTINVSENLYKSNHVFESTGPTRSAVLNVLIPRGLSYRGEHDWYLHGDSEYIILSINDKYDGLLSDENSNLNGKFACIVYDNSTSAVLQGLSSGPSISSYYSIKQDIHSSQPSQIDYYGSSDPGDTYAKLLTGAVGTTNAFTSSVGGAPRAVAGDALSGRQIITFENPIRHLPRFRIRFFKHDKRGNNELYNFKGKDHVLIFEINTEICDSRENPPSDMERLISAVNKLATRG